MGSWWGGYRSRSLKAKAKMEDPVQEPADTETLRGKQLADFVASMHGGQIQVTGREIEIVPYGDGMGEGSMRTLADAEAEAERDEDAYEASWDQEEEPK